MAPIVSLPLQSHGACVLPEEFAKMAGGASGTLRADMNVDVMCTFNRDKEGFNGVRSMKTDIYFICLDVCGSLPIQFKDVVTISKHSKYDIPKIYAKMQ